MDEGVPEGMLNELTRLQTLKKKLETDIKNAQTLGNTAQIVEELQRQLDAVNQDLSSKFRINITF
ncbi:MAG: hypothetical protein WAN61_01395 [Minisyncoccia bacterium]